MEAPRVTAVVPTHNRPDLMRAAVDSVLQQDYPGPIDVIVVFDACDVELPDVIVPPGRTLRGIGNERTRGLAGARNSGILASDSEYVAFLDDDDEWLQGKLSAQMPVFERVPSAILVGTAMTVDDGERRHLRLVPSVPVRHVDLLHDRMPGLHSSSFVFRREHLLGDLGLIDEDLPRSYGEDYDILLRVARLTDIPVVNEPLVKVRWAGQSYFFGQWLQYATALRYLLQKHPEFAESPKAIGRIESQIAFALASAGRRREASRWARRAVGNDRTQLKAYLAWAIALRLLTSRSVTRVAQRFGKGI